jgi:EEF1A lysine methyltransferase 4
MCDDGYDKITNIDISYTVVKQMQEFYKDKYPTLIYKHMDCRSLQFEDGAFNAVVDKGTFDSILCGDGSGPSADQMLAEIHRVLAPNGVYICVSYGVKENRQKYFTQKEFDWTVFHHMVAKPTISTSTVVASESKDDKNFHWVYVMRKQAASQ